ncbi:hypothetical protein LR021_01925 [Candidatus Bipolaricaulota bacterium]|nr:hypothetical protein [Candidatus Bipolaricaulota bacterium]
MRYTIDEIGEDFVVVNGERIEAAENGKRIKNEKGHPFRVICGRDGQPFTPYD